MKILLECDIVFNTKTQGDNLNTSKTKKFTSITLSLALINALFINNLAAADLRIRNINNIKTDVNMAKSENLTDVININKANGNGISHNVFSNFDIYDGVIFNNSLKDGNSVTGGFVQKNPNLSTSANTIINEITSKSASNISGALEIFGNKANLIIANENGLNVNNASFINTKGVSLSTGLFNNANINVNSNAAINLSNDIKVDGDYFNVIARSMQVSANIKHFDDNKILNNINLIAGNNEVSLSDMANPKITATKQKEKSDAEFAIDAKLVGSMYANNINFISTEEGLGVRHQGVIKSAKDVMIKANAKVQTNIIDAANQANIDANSIESNILNAKNIKLNAKDDITNYGLILADDVKINANDYINSNEVKAKDVNEVKLAADNISINTKNNFINKANINSTQNININTKNFDNKANISANENVNINLNDNSFKNSGKITSQNNINLNALSSNLDINDNNAYAKNSLNINAKQDLNINSKLENPYNISLVAKNININNLLASNKTLSLVASNAIYNKAYIFANDSLDFSAFSVKNDGTFDSAKDIFIRTNILNNNAYIFAENNLNINASVISNNASLTGDITKKYQMINGTGWVNYGDTAFKRWKMQTGVYVPVFNNSLGANQALMQAKNIYINNDTKEIGLLNNSGKIIANNDLKIYADINNITLNKEIGIKEILEQIKVNGFYAYEYLGSWNTNWTDYFKNGISLYDALVYFASNKAKNHQRGSAWNALKDVASKNKALDEYFKLLFGNDYAYTSYVPSFNKWNLNAKVVFNAKDAALISANNANLVSNINNQGLNKDLKDSFKMINSTLNQAINDKALILKSLPKNFDIFKAGSSKDGINYEYKSDENLINANNYYGFANIAKDLNAKDVLLLGDAYFDYRLINSMLSNSLGFSLDNNEIKALIDNGVEYFKNNDLKIGESLNKSSIDNLDKDMIVYVNVRYKNKEVLAPMLYLSKQSLAKVKANNQLSSILAKNEVNVNTNELHFAFSSLNADKVNISTNEANLNSAKINANKDVNINAQNVNLTSNKSVDNTFNLENKAEINANNINIESDKNIELSNANLNAKNDINLTSNNESVNIKNDVIDNSKFTLKEGLENTISFSKNEEILSSNLNANNININANKNVDITASNVKAKDNINVNANDINVSSANASSNANLSVYFSGQKEGQMAEDTYTNIEVNKSNAVSSNLNANNIILNANNNAKIVASNINAENNAKITAENVNIANANNTSSSKESLSSMQVLGYKQSHTNTEESLVASSNIKAGNLEINANDNFSLKGSNIDAKESSINANSADFIAASNSYKQTKDYIGIGVFANAGLELAQKGVNASYSFNKDVNQSGLTTAANSITSSNLYSNTFANVDVGLEFANTKSSEEKNYYTHNKLNVDNLNINAKNNLDIGSMNIEAKKDVNISAADINSTVYTDTSSKEQSGSSIFLRQRVKATSAIASAINQAAQNVYAEQANKGVNGAIAAAQAVANSINIATNKLAGITSMQSVGISHSNSESKNTSDNINKINANNINITSTKGDITLNGYELAANDSVKINAKKDFNLNAVKNTEDSKSSNFTLLASVTENVGIDVKNGASLSGGLDGYAEGSYKSTQATNYKNSSINAKNNFTLTTGNDANLDGANISAKSADLNVANDLNINSKVDTLKSNSYFAMLDASASAGLSSSHIVAGDASGGIGFGYAKTDNKEVKNQSSISVRDELNANINKDLNLNAAVLNSNTQEGKINIAGKLNNNDLDLYKKSDGAKVIINAGQDGSFGGTIQINDHIESDTKLNSAINVKTNTNTDISTNTHNTSTTTDKSWAGGSINLNTAISKVKDGISKLKDGYNALTGKTGSYDVSSEIPVHINEETNDTRL